MLYTDLLQFGHWETFLDYVWAHTDCAPVSGCDSAAAWIRQAKGREDQRIEALFEKSQSQLYDVVEAYFQLPTSKKDHCLRCNNNFREKEKDFCGHCGWDYMHANQLEEKDLKKAIEFNEHLNAQKMHQKMVHYKRNRLLKQLDQEARQWSEACTVLELEERALMEQISVDQRASEEKAGRKYLLESRLALLDDEIKQMNTILKNTDSMYKSFEPLPHSLTISLHAEGYKLVASSRPNLKFPIDLIMALKRANISGDVIKHACCFLFIKREDWKEFGENKWYFDLTQKVAGKVVPGPYQVHFTHLHLKEYNCKIDFVSKKMTFS